MKSKSKIFNPLLVAVAALLAASIVLGRVWTVLPKVLGDELIYSMDARHLTTTQSLVPNYLFNALFGATNLCGYGFYQCGKVINLLMLFALGAVIYLTARLLASPRVSLWIAALTILGPISAYVSYFTPDVMYFLAAAVAIYFQISQNEKSVWWNWALLGAGVGLAALIKPHALFLVVPAVAFIVYLSFRNGSRRFSWAAISSGAFAVPVFVVKLGLGFLFAGKAGLVLFGAAYDSSAQNVVNNKAATIVPALQVVTNVDPNSASAHSWSFSNPVWLLSAGFSGLLHLAFLVAIFAVPIMAGFAKSDSEKIPLPEVYHRLRFVVLANLATMSLVSAAYVVFSKSWGENLDNRVMVRYYEFALVFLPILITPFLTRSAKFPNVAKWSVGVVSLGLILFVLPFFQGTVPAMYTDSSLIAALQTSGIGIFVIALAGWGLLLWWFSNYNLGSKVWLFGFAPAVILIFSFSSYLNMTVQSSYVGPYTQASQWAHNHLTTEQKSSLVIYGNPATKVQAAQLWVDSVGATGRVAAQNAVADVTGLKSGTYILLIGPVVAPQQATLIHKEVNFQVLVLK